MDYVQIEYKRNNKANTVFKSDLKVNRKEVHGYDALLDVFVNNGKEMSIIPTCSINLSFEHDNYKVAEQLWNTGKPIIKSKISQVRTLLYKANVLEDARYPFLRKFDTLKEFVKVYMVKSPGNNGDDSDVDYNYYEDNPG